MTPSPLPGTAGGDGPTGMSGRADTAGPAGRPDDGVRVERDGAVAVVVLDRPDRGNALTHQMLTETLPATWQRLGTDPDVRVIVVTGAGERSFCTGADLADPAIGRISTGGQEAPPLAFTPRQHGVWKPVICAVNGTCAGGALAFLADSDLIVAATGASFTNPGVSVGIQTTLGPVGLVHRAAFPLLVSLTIRGRHARVDAATARDGGLVDEVVPADRLQARARELADEIASNSPAAVQDALWSLWNARGRVREDALADATARIVAFRDHPDAAEGRAAWEQDRPARWAPASPSASSAGDPTPDADAAGPGP